MLRDFRCFVADYISHSELMLALSLRVEIHTKDIQVVRPFIDLSSKLPQYCKALESFVWSACHHSAFLEDRYCLDQGLLLLGSSIHAVLKFVCHSS